MDKRLCIFLLLVFICFQAFCESPVLQNYKRQFSMGDMPAKIQILEEAAFNRELGESKGLLYEFALAFALNNFEFLKDDPELTKIINISINGLQNEYNIQDINVLWELFLKYQDSNTGADLIIVMGKLGKNNKYIIDNINNFLLEQNRIFISGGSNTTRGGGVNYTIVSACITAIMELGDISSLPALFGIISAGYPEVITFEAYGAIELIPGNLMQFLLEIIENSKPSEKYIAFRIAEANQRLTPSELGQLAEIALEQCLISYSSDNDLDLLDMRYAAVVMLTKLRWTRANTLAIRNYYRVHADYQHETASKERLLEGIELLGAVGNSDAALALGLQLGLIHTRTGRTGEYDREITLAVVQALGAIGDKDAFDLLLTVSYLSYSEDIQAAAREAIDRLRW